MGTSFWTFAASGRKDPKLASTALRVSPNFSASRNMSVRAQGPSHLGMVCICAAPMQYVLHLGMVRIRAVRRGVHQFVQSEEGRTTARIG